MKSLEQLAQKANSTINNTVNGLKDLAAEQKENSQRLDNQIGQVLDEQKRVTTIYQAPNIVIEDVDKEFKAKTRLQDSDIAFLFICTALQCARQYLLSNDKLRLTAVEGDALIEKALSPVTPPGWEDVLFQSVPYDAIRTGNHIIDTGIAGTTHRYRTLGHDPVLGWIFGTANIMTSSLTKTDFVSYQVSNNTIIRHYPRGTAGVLDKTIQYAQKDPKLLAASVARQAIHYGSDYFTKQGLPIPLIATANNDLAKRMITKGHIDMWSVTRGTILAALINQLIMLAHRLFYDESKDGPVSLFEVRTRKILSYSNALSTGSNIVVSACTKNLNLLDVGGAIETLHRFVADAKFIHDIKRDFLKNELYKTVVGSQYDFMEGRI